MEHNPYQTPAASLETLDPAAIADADVIRREHLTHEASVRSIGLLYYIGAVGMLIVAASQLMAFDTEQPVLTLLLLALFAGLGALYLWLGSGLRALKLNVRPVAGVFAALGLIGFPLGTLINGYILYLLFSAKGKVVFSDEYQEVRDATPHIRYKTSIVVWLILALLLLAMGAAVLVPMLNS